MDRTPHSLDSVLAQTWERLTRAAATPGDPWRLGVLGTVEGRQPTLRTVVLRGADAEARVLTFHTDVRSPKAVHIRFAPQVEWVFYDPAAGVQARVRGRAALHCGNELAARGWESTPAEARRIYASALVPGTVLPAAVPVEKETLSEEQRGLRHFAVVVVTVERLEWLLLDPVGHRRAAFTWNGERFAGAWLAP